MVLSKEANERLTRVGPGTPGGELLRRYWHALCPAAELTAERPTKRVRLLGEDLVLFRQPNGSYGLVAEQCGHRGCSLYYGFVEDAGLRCAYHGWVWDKSGKCIEQPFEPAESMMKHVVHQAAYPVERIAGLLFAYLGPAPTPLLPRWDVFAREDGIHHIQVQPVIDCNWLQAEENSLDPTHVYYLHGHTLLKKGITKQNNYRPITGYDFEPFAHGIRKKRIYGGDGLNTYEEPGHPAVFPTILRHHSEGRNGFNPHDGTMPIDMHLRIPIDDTHTQVIWIGFTPSPDGSTTDPYTEEPSLEYVETLWDERGDFHMRTYPSHDSMAWVTQGPIWDRSKEHLGAGDRGIAMWRQLLEEQIAIVEAGGDPINVFRDPEQNQLIAFSATRVKEGDRYVPSDSEAARAWQEYRPGSREIAQRRQEEMLVAARGEGRGKANL
ncbi:MAG: 5,5-dehydrodivanillate O-demethylase oxygenase subunit [Chloroflexota bacterium]|jgi:5,5'-dehydrodivanillate O-demethylase|nr:5,5-dehydrodivanillate O-demethylase oxygenase subunit [Chloroflexota bacterium]